MAAWETVGDGVHAAVLPPAQTTEPLETFRLAGGDAAFERKLQTPRAFVERAAAGSRPAATHRPR